MGPRLSPGKGESSGTSSAACVDMMRTLRVADVMTAKPISIPPSLTVRDALAIFETLEIRHLPVVDEQQRLIGMVSERDLHSFYAPRQSLALEAVALARRALDGPVSSVMVATPLSIEEAAPLDAAIRKIIDAHLSALPVVREGTLVGVLSFVDLARCLSNVIREKS